MWPKALTQLVELAPHLTRLAPLADRFLKDKASGDEATRAGFASQRALADAQRAALTDLGTSLRADLAALTAAQTTHSSHLAALSRQVTALEAQVTGRREDALALKPAVEALDGRVRTVEQAASRSHRLLLALLGVCSLLAVLLVVILLLLLFRVR